MPDKPPSGLTILVVEDEETIQELLRYNLRQAGHEVLTSGSGESAIEIAREETPSLILLDLALPGIDGLEVCRRLRRYPETKTVPIIMVTARGEETDIVHGLELGADDYITKPFNLQVLFARIRAVLRRRDEVVHEDGELSRGPISVHPGRREVRIDGRKVELTNTEFRILHFLITKPGWVFTRKQIVDKIQSEHYAVTERAVDVQIVGLRKKLGTSSQLIETVRGVGYRFSDD